jgi:hypothetical protein
MIKVIVLASYLLSAMTNWVPKSQHAYYEKQEITDARYMDIATAIAEVSLDPDQDPLFGGDDGRIKTALVMASVASHESFFNDRVVHCLKAGDHGLAWGSWQTHSGKTRTCRDLKTAATIALGMMRHSIEHCKGRPLADRLSLYTNGQCIASYASQVRMNRAIKWYTAHKISPAELEEIPNNEVATETDE